MVDVPYFSEIPGRVITTQESNATAVAPILTDVDVSRVVVADHVSNPSTGMALLSALYAPGPAGDETYFARHIEQEMPTRAEVDVRRVDLW